MANLHRFVANGLMDTLQRSTPPLTQHARLTMDNIGQMVTTYLEGDSTCGSFFTLHADQPAAVVLYRRVSEPLKRSLYIQFAYTAPTIRRTGAVATLFQQVVSLAHAEGLREISARAQEWNLPSRGGLVARGGLQPIEHVYYRTLDRHLSMDAGIKPFTNDDTEHNATVLKQLAEHLVSDVNHLRIRTAGVVMGVDAIRRTLVQYLRSTARAYVLCDTPNMLNMEAFAMCEPVSHPFKDFLSVRVLHSDSRAVIGLLEKAMALAATLDLPEIGVRLFFDQTEMARQLVEHGFVHSDTNYARWFT